MPEVALSPSSPRTAMIVSRVIEKNLPPTRTGSAFRQKLQDLCARLEQDGAGLVSIAQLPALACASVGGDPDAAGPITAAWQLVRLAAKLLDDVEDLEIGTEASVAVNAATALLFTAPLLLNELSDPLDPAIAQRAILALHRAVLRAAAGQHADLNGAEGGAEQSPPLFTALANGGGGRTHFVRGWGVRAWLEIALAKSGELLAWAAWAGALAGGAGEQTQAALRDYGSHLGVLLQVADDFHGIWGPGGASDLAGRHLSLAVCYARSILKDAAREQLQVLLSAAAAGDKAAEAKTVEQLINLGAQAYLLAIARVQQREALAALAQAQPGLAGDRLTALLSQVMPIVACAGA